MTHITISFLPGFDVDGIVLSATGDTMRVAIRDWDDAAEFQYQDGSWVAENGDPVQFSYADSDAQDDDCTMGLMLEPGDSFAGLCSDPSAARMPASAW